jgi:hypothetical protein
MKKRINTNNSRGLYELYIRFSRKKSKKISPALGGLSSVKEYTYIDRKSIEECSKIV